MGFYLSESWKNNNGNFLQHISLLWKQSLERLFAVNMKGK